MGRFRGNWDTGQRRNLRRVLVVGAGRAGVAAAEELRRQGFGGEIMVMGDEPAGPYDRPSCSKGLLTGHLRPKDARMVVQDDLAIQWLLGRQAVHLDTARRAVVTDSDEEFRYDGLVIATGARPMWPAGWPSGAPGLYALHGLDDAWALRRALHRAKRVAVLGGGLTGCEVACAVRSMARDCVLIDSKQQLMSRALGEVVGRYVTGVIAGDGVQLRLGRRCQRLERHRRGWALVLDDGSEVVADVVVATIGERPDTGWLDAAGYDLEDGVRCDENLRVVGGEEVVAAGTVARWPNLRYGIAPRRVGQWIMALEQGRAAAASLLGSDHPSRPAALVPRFWSEQFGLRIQVCGEVPTDGSAEVSVQRRNHGRRDTARAGVLVGYHRGGEQIGVVAVNAARAFTTIARSMLAAPPMPAPQPPPRPLPPARPRPAAGPPWEAVPQLAAGPGQWPAPGPQWAPGQWAPGPQRAAPGPRMIAAAPASPPPAGAPLRPTIDVPASAVREIGQWPASAAPPDRPPATYRPSGYYEPSPYHDEEPSPDLPEEYAEYGPPEEYGDAAYPPSQRPVSPAGRPVSPPPALNPRDRFATGQFAAVR
jgi:NADPH-dependent 2,4-dienoyl-CoA reductase/sulfur reductase-like enzyme